MFLACELLAEYFDKVEDNQEQAYKINALNCEEREWPLSCYRAGSYKLTDEQAMNPVRYNVWIHMEKTAQPSWL